MTQLTIDFGPKFARTGASRTPPARVLAPNPDCTLCRLHKTANTVCLLGNGPKRSDVMIVGEAPGKSEDEQGVPFVGKSGKLLNTILEEYGFDREDVFVTNAVSCRPPDNRTPSKGEVKQCKVWLDHQIEVVQPKFVLLLGNTPLLSITGKTGITTKRGRPFEKDGITYLPTFHPSFVLRDEPTNLPLFEKDIELFRQIVDNGEIVREDNLNLTVVKNERDVRKLLDALEGTVSFDIETNALYPWQKFEVKKRKGKNVNIPNPAKITAIGFGTADGEFSIAINHPDSPWTLDAIDDIVARIDRKLRKCRLVCHNGKFDCLWMLVHFGVTWYEYLDFDTMLAHYILDENSLHSLKLLAQRFCGAPDWDIDRDEKQGNVAFDRLAVYHAHDLYYTRQLYFVFKKLLAKDLEVRGVFRKILMPCARIFCEIEFDGVFIDVDKFDVAEEYLREQYDTALEKLEEWEPKPKRNARGKLIPFNWGSPAQLKVLLFGDKEDGGLEIEPLDKTKTGQPSCSESVLKRIDHPMVGDLLKFREAKQQLSFFIDGWKPFLDKRYVRGQWYYFLHPSFKLHGTVTGRLSCEHPNLQQVPRDERIRSLITAEEGWTLVECDLSQIELRVAAELARERNMIYAFVNNIDVHWLTAIREIERGGGLKDLVLDTARTWKQDKTLDYSESIEVLLEMGPDAAAEINGEWKELRKKAKAINFGYLYGMWWKKFKLYARDNYGVSVTDEQAEASREAFFDLYPDYPKWHKRQKSFARTHGYVRSLSGRKRRLPDATIPEDCPERGSAERQAINSPVQSFANDLNLMALIQLRGEYGRDVVKICGTVHDAILLRVRNDKVVEVTRRLLEIMSWPELLDHFEVDMTTPIEAEAKIGPWGKGVKLEKWMKENKQHAHA